MHVFLVALLLSLPAAPTFKDRVEARVADGSLSLERSLDYLELAVKDPSRLPLEWQTVLDTDPLGGISATAILVEAYQKRRAAGLKASYFSSPAPLEYFFDSDVYPIRVYYDDPALEEKAAEVLRTAEISWQKEVDEWGFYAPPIVSAEGRYLFYLGYAGGAAGYTAPIGTVPETAWDDCASYIVIESGLELRSLGDTVSHELSHATQGAMDCMEPVTFWENTSVFVEMAVFPESSASNRWFSYYFQISPHLSLSEGQSPYWYGGYIWPTFLAGTYGEGWNDARFVREIWERSMQESGDRTNSPTYMEAIDEQLSELGASLNEAFHRFSAARWFVDSQYHEGVSPMPLGNLIYPVPPDIGTMDMDHPSTLIPPEASWPKQYGVNYVLLNRPEGYERTTTVKLAAFEEGVSLALQVVPRDNPLGAITLESTGLLTTITFEPAEAGDVLLVVEHLGEEDFNPNGVSPFGAKYSISVEPAVPLPEISFFSPGTMKAGETHSIRIYGANFQEGATVAFVPEDGIEITNLTFISSNQLEATAKVPADALTGSLTVMVTNPDLGSDSLENAVIVAPADSGKGSGGCSTGGQGGGGAFVLALALGMAILRRRRKA